MTGATYRPLTDMWILARRKVKYYGAYPGGFLWRAKVLLPGKMCHLCSGMVRDDFTVDINPDLKPDLVADARSTGLPGESFDAVLIDPPYTPADAEKYSTPYPKPKHLMVEAYRLVKPGGRVGMLHFLFVPKPATDARLLAVIGVLTGCNGKIRVLTVYEKPSTPSEKVERTREMPSINILSFDEEARA